MQEEMGLTIGQTAKKKFLIALLSGLLGLGALAAIFGVSATAVALPLGGMGDFYVELDELKGKGFKLTPYIGETGNADAVPMVRNTIDEATIKGLHIYKDLKLPTGKWIRIHVKAEGDTTVKGLIQDARHIDADLDLSDMAIAEKNTTDFTENWTQSAETITISNAKIVTDYLFQSLVSLEGAKISIEDIDSPEILD